MTQGSNPRLLTSAALAGVFFATSTTWEVLQEAGGIDYSLSLKACKIGTPRAKIDSTTQSVRGRIQIFSTFLFYPGHQQSE